MDLKDIRQRKDADLMARITEIAGEIFKLRCTAERLSPQKGELVRALRRENAQIRTVLRQRQLNASAKQALLDVEQKLKAGEVQRTHATGRRRERLARQVRETVQPVAE
jgi:ribosomal protein L29